MPSRITRLALGAVAPLVLGTALAVPADASAAPSSRVKVPRVYVNEGATARLSIPLVCRAHTCNYRTHAVKLSATPHEDYYVPRATTKVLTRDQTTTVTYSVETIDDQNCERLETVRVLVPTSSPTEAPALVPGPSDTVTP